MNMQLALELLNLLKDFISTTPRNKESIPDELKKITIPSLMDIGSMLYHIPINPDIDWFHITNNDTYVWNRLLSLSIEEMAKYADLVCKVKTLTDDNFYEDALRVVVFEDILHNPTSLSNVAYIYLIACDRNEPNIQEIKTLIDEAINNAKQKYSHPS